MVHLRGVFRPVCCYMLPVLAVLLAAAEPRGTRISCAAAGANASVPDALAEIEQLLQSHPPAWELENLCVPVPVFTPPLPQPASSSGHVGR